MCSYNKVNGIHASENHFLLTEVLRDEWGFDGFVMSDWGAVQDRVRALKAGLDLEMPANPTHEAGVVAALESGDIDQATIDTAYARIVRILKLAQASLDGAPDTFDVDAHHALARKAAEQSIVLLSNDGILPLAAETKVAVVGEFARTPRYQGAGSSRVNPTRLDNALDAISAIVGHEVPFAPGFSHGSDGSPSRRAPSRKPSRSRRTPRSCWCSSGWGSRTSRRATTAPRATCPSSSSRSSTRSSPSTPTSSSCSATGRPCWSRRSRTASVRSSRAGCSARPAAPPRPTSCTGR